MEEKKEKKSVPIGVFLQSISTIIVFVLGILTCFIKDVFPYFIFSMGVCLIFMAFNNATIYHKKRMTLMYLLIALLLIVYGFLTIFEVM